MNRNLDNQPNAPGIPEHLRQQIQNAHQNLAGLLSSNLNLLGLQSLIQPILNPDSSSSTLPVAPVDQRTSAQPPPSQQQPPPSQPPTQPSQPVNQHASPYQQPQNLSFKRRGRRPKQIATSLMSSNDALSINNFPLPGHSGANSAPGLSTGAGGSGASLDIFPAAAAANPNANQLDGYGPIARSVKIHNQQLRAQQRQQQQQQQRQQQQLIQQQQRQQQQQQQHQHQHQHQQDAHNELTQRLHQHLQQILQQARPQQQQQQPAHYPHPNLAGDAAASTAATLSFRQQQALQNPLQPVSFLHNAEQKRKRGRPPLSCPSTSGAAAAAAAAAAAVSAADGLPFDYNCLNMFASVKNQQQQERERLQQNNKLQIDKQRDIRMQQERERQREIRLAQERHRELRLQQERERQRIEIERQRKAQHRLALQDIDRERRRQHMMMVKNLDAYKRNEEREKVMIAMMIERNKQFEKRLYQKRLEVELIKEIRKPVDDMMLKNQKPLTTLNRIPGLKLPGKAFADLLMSYEFLFNFGETVGLELKQIPDINTLQLGLLNHATWAEDKFIAVLHHLCMFAIKDPRFPYTGSTKEIENLEKTNEGLSQLLHFYLQVLTLNSKTDMEHEFRLYKLIEQKYFLSLNATQKAEMLAFICNELLCSQTVTKQMEDTIEMVAKLRKDKWVLENELRKYRCIKTKRDVKEEAGLKAKETLASCDVSKAEDGKIDKSEDLIKEEPDKDEDEKLKPNLTNGSSVIEGSSAKKDKDETDTSLQPNNVIDLDDLEPGMSNDDLLKKIENLSRQYNKTSNKLERAINSMRASPLGQDRYRRRFWVIPQVGGVFVEGIESSEPEELENNKFTEEELLEYEKEEQELNALSQQKDEEAQKEEGQGEDEEGVDNPEKSELKEEKNEDEEELKEEPTAKDEEEPLDIKEEDAEGSDIKEENKMEVIENGELETDRIAESSTNGPENPTLLKTPWFSILPRNSCDFTTNQSQPEVSEETECGEARNNKLNEEENTESKPELSYEELLEMRHEICPTLAKKLEDLEAEQYDTPRKIHPQYQYGWWRITDAQQLKAILSVLHERGARERVLQKHLSKHFQYACNSCKNVTVDFEITSYDRQLAGKNYGAPMPHTDDDSADEDLKYVEDEEEEEAEELDEETGDDKAVQQAANAPIKKTKRKKVSRSARSRRLRARAAARKKVENSKSKIATK